MINRPTIVMIKFTHNVVAFVDSGFITTSSLGSNHVVIHGFFCETDDKGFFNSDPYFLVILVIWMSMLFSGAAV